MFTSSYTVIGESQLPPFSGTRVMMMPYHVHDPLGSLPAELRPFVPLLWEVACESRAGGVGYLTIDEACLKVGEFHRRPGLHVDGVGEDPSMPAPYGGGGGYGANGMYLISSHRGCQAWRGTFEGAPGPDGDCEHLRDQVETLASSHIMQPNTLYWCSPLCVHESLMTRHPAARQFVRVSMPSDAPWHEGYTPNPLGILPTGPIHGPRKGMRYRP